MFCVLCILIRGIWLLNFFKVQNVLNFTMLLFFNFRSTSDRSGKDCCGQWFVGPPLRILVVLMALGGIACTLGGATMGATALAGSPTSHLTAGLLMTGKILFQFIINFYGFFVLKREEKKKVKTTKSLCS